MGRGCKESRKKVEEKEKEKEKEREKGKSQLNKLVSSIKHEL
jgi:hypothetical protein